MANSIYIAKLAGRCSSGLELGKGSKYHAVNGEILNNRELHGKALCGAKPGPRSVGWSIRTDEKVTCPRCLKHITGD